MTIPPAFSRSQGSPRDPSPIQTHYNCSQSIDITHPQGDRIHLVGTGTVNLTFPAGTDGIRVVDRDLGHLANLSLSGGDTHSGLYVRNGSVAVTDVDISQFATGMLVDSGGQVRGTGGSTNLNVGVGTVARHGGVIRLTGFEASNNGSYGFMADRATIRLQDPNGTNDLTFGATASQNGRAGFYATQHGHLHADNAFASQNGQTDVHPGFYANMGSTMTLNYPVSAENTGSGFISHLGSRMFLWQDPTSNLNGQWGFAASQGSMIRADGTIGVSGNTSGDYSPTPGTETDLGALIHVTP